MGIRSFGRGILYYPPMRGSELSKLRYFTFPSDALAISNIKAWEGAISTTSESDVGVVASNRFLFYRSCSGDVDIRFLRYYFLSENGLRQMSQASPGSADRNRTLSMKSFERIVLELPAIDEQRRIAAKLDRAFGHIGQVNELRARARRLREALTQSVLEATTQRAMCKAVRLGDILRLERISIQVNPEQQYTQIGIRSFGRGIFHREPTLGSELSQLRYFNVSPGRLIVSNIMAWEGAIAVSADNDAGCIGSQRFLSYLPTGDVDLDYLNSFFQSRDGKALIRKASTGTVMRNQTLSIDHFEGLVVSLPDIAEQRRVSRVLAHSDLADIMALGEEKILEGLRRSLLNAAFSGQH